MACNKTDGPAVRNHFNARTTALTNAWHVWGSLLSNDALGRASYDTVLGLMATPIAPDLVGIQWHDVFAQSIGAQYLRLQQLV